MEWINISSVQFEALRDESGVCIVPLGCLERHSDHLPLGTDSLLAYRLACLAAELEPAIVFPPQHYMMVASAAAHPGAIVFDVKQVIALLEHLFTEISRNGFKKIILYNFHGGNRNITPLLLQNHLARQPLDYMLYMPKFDWEIEDVIKVYCDSKFGGHADEWETSLMLYLYPHLVNMAAVPEPHVGLPQHRLQAFKEAQVKTPFDFYADYPTHYAGEAKWATAEKGERAAKAIIERLARVIRLVREDSVAPALQQEFAELTGRIA